MTTRVNSVAIATFLFSAGAASAAFRGGAVLTNDAWNAAASAAIGQSVTVTRHYLLFDEADDTALINGLNRNIEGDFDYVRTRDGSSLYQHAFGNDSVNGVNAGAFGIMPALQWDSFLTHGPLVRNDTFNSFIFGGSRVAFADDGIVLSEGVASDGAWYLLPRSMEEPGSGAIYSGTAGMPHNVFDADTGLYGVAVAQMTLFGTHDEFTSFSEAGPSIGVFSSRLFTGGMRMYWNDFLGESPIVEDLSYANPSPGAAGLLTLAGVSAARRRR